MKNVSCVSVVNIRWITHDIIDVNLALTRIGRVEIYSNIVLNMLSSYRCNHGMIKYTLLLLINAFNPFEVGGISDNEHAVICTWSLVTFVSEFFKKLNKCVVVCSYLCLMQIVNVHVVMKQKHFILELGTNQVNFFNIRFRIIGKY